MRFLEHAAVFMIKDILPLHIAKPMYIVIGKLAVIDFEYSDMIKVL